MARAAAVTAVLVAVMVGGATRAPARAGAVVGPARAPVAPHARVPPAPAPSGGSGVVVGGDPAGSGGGIASASDPLSANGFSSALCRSARASLSATTREHCLASGLSVAGAPISHFGFDIHIDTPLTPSGATAAIVIQDILLTPVWTALVWLIHALIVALEWCYSINLLDSRGIGGVAASLAASERAFTEPWLVVALAIASVGVAYRGLVRRGVSDALGQAAVMAAMMVAALGLISSPRETVGELSSLVNRASLGTVSAVASGTPEGSEQSLADGLQGVFDSAVQGPWCYMEFGDVGWCRDRPRLDPALRRAAIRLAAGDRQRPPCPAGSPASGACRVWLTPAQADQALARALLPTARTNGDVFLAFGANGPARNSINDSGSLLHILCHSDDATACTGPNATQAQFRNASGTWPRAGGLLFITLGVLGMLALLGFICLRLLGAALLSVFFLLMAPLAVLAPALGESGRSMFRAWASRLLGALATKLVYSVFLGVVLSMVRVLTGLGSLGWWTQWLLIAVFWWTVFHHRHRVWEHGTVGNGDRSNRNLRVARAGLTGRGGGALLLGRSIGRLRSAGRGRGPGALSSLLERLRETSARPPAAPSALARSATDASEPRRPTQTTAVDRLLEGWHREAVEQDAYDDRSRPDFARDRQRVKRLTAEAVRARGSGDVRRAAHLEARASALDQGSDPAEKPTRRGAGQAIGARASVIPGGLLGAGSRRAEAERLLDHQATLRRGVPPGPRTGPDGYRDYASLSWLAGRASAEYARLDAGAQRAARLEIDRQLRIREKGSGPVEPQPPIPARPPAARRASPSRHARQFLSVSRPRPELRSGPRSPDRSGEPPAHERG